MSTGATQSKTQRAAIAVAVCAFEIGAGSGGAVPEEIRLLPDGEFAALDGRRWDLTPDAAARIVARLRGRQTRIVVDYEHQTLHAGANGQPAPAAGWVDPQSVEYRPGQGIYGRVTWTAKAATAIEADEYAYLSPVFPHGKDGVPTDLYHIALTNFPALTDQEALGRLAAARFSPTTTEEESIVDRTQLIAALGLAADASDADINAAVAAGREAQAGLAALRQSLDLEEGEEPGQAIAALKSSGSPDPAKWVPVEVYDEARQQLAALKANGDEAEIDRLIEEGLADGRIAGKATADYLREGGLAMLKAHMDDAVPVAALTASQTGGKKPEDEKKKDGELTEEELAVCKNTGVDPADYTKQKGGDD